MERYRSMHTQIRNCAPIGYSYGHAFLMLYCRGRPQNKMKFRKIAVETEMCVSHVCIIKAITWNVDQLIWPMHQPQKVARTTYETLTWPTKIWALKCSFNNNDCWGVTCWYHKVLMQPGKEQWAFQTSPAVWDQIWALVPTKDRPCGHCND